jgi:hypothetical protein
MPIRKEACDEPRQEGVIVHNRCGRYEAIAARELAWRSSYRATQAMTQAMGLPHRKIDMLHPNWRYNESPTTTKRVVLDRKGRTRPIMKTPSAPHIQGPVLRDAIKEGEDLARSRDVVLPFDGPGSLAPPYGFQHYWLYNDEGLFVELDDSEEISLEDIPVEEPAFTIRAVAPRRARRRSVPESEVETDNWDLVSVASACSFVKV